MIIIIFFNFMSIAFDFYKKTRLKDFFSVRWLFFYIFFLYSANLIYKKLNRANKSNSQIQKIMLFTLFANNEQSYTHTYKFFRGPLWKEFYMFPPDSHLKILNVSHNNEKLGTNYQSLFFYSFMSQIMVASHKQRKTKDKSS